MGRGAHCKNLVSGGSGIETTETYALQTVDGNDVQASEEQLISHQNGHEQVAKHQGTEMVLSIREPIESRHDYPGEVEQCDESEELLVRVEP